MEMEKFVDLGAALPLTEQDRKDMKLRTEPVKMRMLAREIRTLGRFETDETKDKVVSAWIDGRIEKVYADFKGVPVKTGWHLFDLYSPDLYASQSELLVARNSVNKQTEGTQAYASQMQLLKLARQKLRLLGLTAEQVKFIEQQKEPSLTLTIPSPTDGIVIEKMANEGMYVTRGQALYRVADLSRLWLMLDVHERDAPWLALGQRVALEATGLPGTKFGGVIGFIDPTLNTNTRTISVRVEVPNEDGMLRPGMFATAHIFARFAADGTVAAPKLKGKYSCPMHPLERSDEHGLTCPVCGMDMIEHPQVETEAPGYVIAVPRKSVLTTGVRHLVYIEDWVERDRDGNTVFDDDGFAIKLDSPLYKPVEVELGPLAAEWKQKKDGTWKKLGDYYAVKSGAVLGMPIVTKAHFLIDSALELTGKPSLLNVGADTDDPEQSQSSD